MRLQIKFETMLHQFHSLIEDSVRTGRGPGHSRRPPDPRRGGGVRPAVSGPQLGRLCLPLHSSGWRLRSKQAGSDPELQGQLVKLKQKPANNLQDTDSPTHCYAIMQTMSWVLQFCEMNNHTGYYCAK
jgi:hypothetical protein